MADNSESPLKVTSSIKFAQNSIYSIIGFAITFPILIIITPYMLHMLGKTNFGLWAIAGVVTSYANLSEMGMTTAIVKFVAENWRDKDIGKINKIVSTVFISFIIIGGLAVIIVLISRTFLINNLLKVHIDMQPEAKFVITGIIIIFYFNLVFGVFNSILLGLQRMDLTNKIFLASKILRAFGIWFFLSSGMGLKGLIINGAILSGLTITANIVISKKLLPQLNISFKLFSISTLIKIFSYSTNILMANILGLFQLPVNKIIISRYIGLPFVAFYEIGERVTKLFRQLFTTGLQPLLPFSSELQRMNQKNDIVKILLDISRLLFLVMLPLFVIITVMAEPIITIWLGNDYILAARTVQYLSLGFFITILATPYYVILQGIGKVHINTINHLLSVVVNIILGIYLCIRIGYYGMLIANVLSFFVGFLYLEYFARKILNIKLKEYINNIPFSYITTVCISGLVMYLFIFYNTISNLFSLMAAFSISLLILIILFLIFSNKNDKVLVKKIFNVTMNILKNKGVQY